DRCLGIRYQRVSVAVGGDPTHGLRSAGDGEADCRDRRRRSPRRADARTRRGDRTEARRLCARGWARAVDRPAGRSRAALGARARDGAPVRHRGVRPQDGAALRSVASCLARHEAPRRAGRRSVVSHRRRGRVTLRPGLVLAAVFLCVYGTFALAVDFPRAAYGFHSDEATYYMMAWSLVVDHDLAYRKDALVRVWMEFPSGLSGVVLATFGK